MADPEASVATPSPWADLWLLDPSVAYLNHGSFGACPRAILDHQSALRLRLEREPVDFLVRELPGLLAGAREALAGFPPNRKTSRSSPTRQPA
jgi:isopenicillin-N epimerase